MSLRYRLFLWISGLFLFVATCSWFLETYVSHHALTKAQTLLRKKIVEMSEERRLDLQNFLAGSIAENQVRIDAILSNITSFSPQAQRFGPTRANERRGTWGEASDLLLEYKWIDFLQNTNEEKLTAGIIPEQNTLDTSWRMAIDEDLCWIWLGDLQKHPDPYLGVRVPYSMVTRSGIGNADEVLEQVTGVVPSAFLLFEVEGMTEPQSEATQKVFQSTEKQTLSPILVKWTEGYELDLAPFVSTFQRAREQLLLKKIQMPQLALDEVKEKMLKASSMQDGKLVPMPTEMLLASFKNISLVNERLEEVALRYTQINLIWVLLAMYDSGIFGNDLFCFPAPSAATVFCQNNEIGIGLMGKEIFFPKPFFDDRGYYGQNAPEGGHSSLGSSLAVIPSPKSGHVFLGNTAKFTVHSPVGEKNGYLTLAIDADDVLKKLVLAVRQAVVLVHAGQPFSAYSEDGKKIAIATAKELPIAKMLGEKSGILPWKNQNWFYMNVKPFPEIDLYFFLFNPEEKEFALLRDLETGSEAIVSSILLNTHLTGIVGLLIAVILLNNISRRITGPITQLAKATDDVVEGRLGEIRLSLPPLTHRPRGGNFFRFLLRQSPAIENGGGEGSIHPIQPPTQSRELSRQKKTKKITAARSKDEIAVLCHSFEEMVKGLQEKEKVKGVLNKVVSREIAQEILQGTVHLGGEEKKVTVLFADIRDFTKITQNMAPQEVIDLLNVCMTKISRVIDDNGGVIDKYVGDEAMALFGAPITRDEDAMHAIVSAIGMLAVIREWNEERVRSAKVPIELGVGIHTGQMLAGNMGAENRLNYTVLGSNVNLASRLCGFAKRMEILISKDTLEEPSVRERILYEEVPAVTFKGFDKPVNVYRVLGIKT